MSSSHVTLHLDEEGNTSLHRAARDGDLGTVRALVDAFPDWARVANRHGSLPLNYAACAGHADIVALLLGAFPEAARMAHPGPGGGLPLHDAARNDHATTKLLLDAYPEGAAIKDGLGFLPLHGAAYRGRADNVTLLLEAYPAGACVATNQGHLPLHWAQREGHHSCASLLGAVDPPLERHVKSIPTC